MKQILRYSYGLARIILGVLMINAGIQKFNNNIPSSEEHLEKLEQYMEDGNENYFAMSAYIGGMKVSGFAYEVLAISEILLGLLLVIQFTSFIGAIFLLPITLHIFLFHLFLESDDFVEVLITGIYFLVNLLLVTKEYKRFKHLLWIKP